MGPRLTSTDDIKSGLWLPWRLFWLFLWRDVQFPLTNVWTKWRNSRLESEWRFEKKFGWVMRPQNHDGQPVPKKGDHRCRAPFNVTWLVGLQWWWRPNCPSNMPILQQILRETSVHTVSSLLSWAFSSRPHHHCLESLASNPWLLNLPKDPDTKELCLTQQGLLRNGWPFHRAQQLLNILTPSCPHTHQLGFGG